MKIHTQIVGVGSRGVIRQTARGCCLVWWSTGLFTGPRSSQGSEKWIAQIAALLDKMTSVGQISLRKYG